MNPIRYGTFATLVLSLFFLTACGNKAEETLSSSVPSSSQVANSSSSSSAVSSKPSSKVSSVARATSKSSTVAIARNASSTQVAGQADNPSTPSVSEASVDDTATEATNYASVSEPVINSAPEAINSVAPATSSAVSPDNGQGIAPQPAPTGLESLSGTWVNSQGQTLTVDESGNVLVDGTTLYNVSDVSRQGNGQLSAGLTNPNSFGGIGFVYLPAGEAMATVDGSYAAETVDSSDYISIGNAIGTPADRFYRQ